MKQAVHEQGNKGINMPLIMLLVFPTIDRYFPSLLWLSTSACSIMYITQPIVLIMMGLEIHRKKRKDNDGLEKW